MKSNPKLHSAERADVATEFVAEDEVTLVVDSKAFDHTKKYSDEFYEDYILNFEQNTKKRWFYRFMKRFFDITVSLFAMILLAPVFLIIAVVIRCDSKGPAIFAHDRIGKDGKPFRCYKFRSMYVTAPPSTATSVLKDPDQYYTRVGRVLRRTSLDELPQLFSVFIGKMSIIGYRPLVVTEEKCNKMRQRLGVFVMRPGISGYAQVNGRDDVYYKNKAIMDAYYVKHASLGLDIKLLFQTVGVVLKRKGVHSGEKHLKSEEREKEEGGSSDAMNK